MSRVSNLLPNFGLTVIATLIMAGCSSSGDNGTSDKAAAEIGEANFPISSPNFTEIRPKKRIPEENTCYGNNSSPPLSWTGAPKGTQSFALIVDEPGHESGSWAHWVLFDIPAGMTELSPGIPTSTKSLPDGVKQGTNDFRSIGYNGPCPPPLIVVYDTFTSRMGEAKTVTVRKFQFTIYALDSVLKLEAGSTRTELIDAMEGHVLGQAKTAGKFTRQLGLQGKGGTGFMKTAGQDNKKPSENAAPTREKIYNSMGELITPTPTGEQ